MEKPSSNPISHIVKPRIAIIGEFRPASRSHVALNASLEHVQHGLGYDFEYQWVDTAVVERSGNTLLDSFVGFWSAPGGLFNSLQGTLDAIRYAREKNIPHLATCGGFQHAILEYAHNVLGMPDAKHEDYAPEASLPVISRLTCSLMGELGKVCIQPGTRAHESYGVTETEENFLCNFGVNPEFKENLTEAGLEISGSDEDGEIRIAELPAHRFFIATLFVPHLKSTIETPHPLVRDFIKAAVL